MSSTTTYQDAHVAYGIDEVYLQNPFDLNLLKKLQRRAEITLDGSDPVVLKNVKYDLILVFHKKVQTRNMIYKYLKFLQDNPAKDADFYKSHLLLNEDELFEAIKLKKFVLVTLTDLTTEGV